MAAPGTPLGGLTGLYGRDEAEHGRTGRDPVQAFGGPPDARHAIPGDASTQVLFHGTSYGAEVEVQDELPAPTPQGGVFDRTPSSHAAPYPQGLTHDPEVAAAQMRALHGVDLGGPAHAQSVRVPYEQALDQSLTNSPNTSALVKVPGQLRSGGVGDDVDQGYGTVNGFGFEFGRRFRRWFTDPVPRDHTNLYGGERPFRGHHGVGQMRLDGLDSPYGVAGDISRGMNIGPTPVGLATPYEQPPNPSTRTSTDYPAEAPITEGWMAG